MANKPRDIREVIDQLKEVIPNENHYHNFLDDVADSSMYRAPEIQYLDWYKLSEIVSDIVEIYSETDIDAVDKWKLEALRILTDSETIDDVKKLHKEK